MTDSARRIARVAAAALTALAVGGLLALAWLVPIAAIGVVWPLLFLVPGWAMLALVKPRIGTSGRLGLAIVLSVAVSAHLVYYLSLVGGYRRETIFVAAASARRPAAGGRLARRAARSTPAAGGRARSAPRARGAGLRARCGRAGGRRAVDLALARDPRRRGGRRLELERPGRAPLDRPVAQRRQLPPAGPLLRRRAAHLSLVRRLPCRHRR